MAEMKNVAGRRAGTAATDAQKKIRNTQSAYMFHRNEVKMCWSYSTCECTGHMCHFSWLKQVLLITIASYQSIKCIKNPK